MKKNILKLLLSVIVCITAFCLMFLSKNNPIKKDTMPSDLEIATLENRVDVALGNKKADLVIRNAKIINVFTEEIEENDIAIAKDTIVAIGKNYSGIEEIDVKGAYVSPSFIDGHMHIESTKMLPHELAKLIVPSGTTTIMADPHEIANVHGKTGINFMKDISRELPLDVYLMLSPCVPSTHLETSGAALKAEDFAEFIDKDWTLGFAELMNVPGVLYKDKDILKKIALGNKYGKRIDGHCPLTTGRALNAYIATGVQSDHECTNAKEAEEKIKLGMYLMARQGSAARDLEALMPVIKKYYNVSRRIVFVTDDREPNDLTDHISSMVRYAVEQGIPPIKAIQMASLNTAEYFRIYNLGAVAPSYQADLLVMDDLKTFKPKMVIKKGKVVAKDGKLVVKSDVKSIPELPNSMNYKPFTTDDLSIKANGKNIQVIKVNDGQLVTEKFITDAKIVNGYAVADVQRDIAKIVVVERHKASGRIGKGFVNGFGLQGGAIASTVAHDSHDLMIVGTNDEDMKIAADKLNEVKGGQVVVKDGKVLAVLPLPYGGLLSNKTSQELLKEMETMQNAVKQTGCVLKEPFMTLSFLGLPVIPELKVTDFGLIDFEKFAVVDVFEK